MPMFAALWADGLRKSTGRRINFIDYTGLNEPSPGREKSSATLLASLQSNETARDAAKKADIMLIATGPNELTPAIAMFKAGTCGGADHLDCIRALGVLWTKNFDAILTEVSTLRAGSPTAIRLVDAANGFASDAQLRQGLPDDFPTKGGALIFELLKTAMCGVAAKHGATCVDVLPIVNGATMAEPGDDNSPESMQAIANALIATGLAELK